MMAMALAAVLATQVAPAPAPPSPQALFDQATAEADAGRCAEAITRFGALEADPRLAHSPNTLAVIRMRTGDCLLTLGRPDEAQLALSRGLASLDSDAPAYGGDIARARMDLGRIAYQRLDYPVAEREFTLAAPGADPTARLNRLLWLARATMFDPDAQAQTYADEALALAAATPHTPKETLAELHTIHARVLLNHGHAAKAYQELIRALRDQGGLTKRVSVSDVVTRSDLAIAALLNKDQEGARKYLVYSGSGRFKKGPFGIAASMDLPPCGGPADLRPDDVAIVEFGIGDDGAVSYADPIYVSRTGPAAVAFARAVEGWSWRPEDIKVVPPFFRQLNRVELRCSTVGEHPAVSDLLRPDFDAWLVSEGVPPFTAPSPAASAVEPERAELARREAAAGGGPPSIPVLMALAANPVIEDADQRDFLIRARDIAAQAGAPPAARVFVEILLARAVTRAWWHQLSSADPGAAELRALLKQPVILADARAAAALHLETARIYALPAQAAQELEDVADDSRLSAHDPLRVAALLRLASLQARTGKLAAARVSYDKTGLTAQQCSIVDAKPAFHSKPDTSNAFPMEALRWGFEGWVKLEFDVAPDGATLHQRAVIAYPPFVFKDAAVNLVKDFRFNQTYRPQGGPGCSGADESIVFELPR